MAYVTAEDVRTLGGNAEAIEEFDDDTILSHASTIEAEANGHLRTRYSVPLVAEFVSADIKRHIARATWYSLVDNRGLSPQGDNTGVFNKYTEFKAFFKSISQGVISLDVGITASTSVDGPAVYSDEPRESRWGNSGYCDDDWV